MYFCLPITLTFRSPTLIAASHLPQEKVEHSQPQIASGVASKPGHELIDEQKVEQSFTSSTAPYLLASVSSQLLPTDTLVPHPLMKSLLVHPNPRPLRPKHFNALQALPRHPSYQRGARLNSNSLLVFYLSLCVPI